MEKFPTLDELKTKWWFKFGIILKWIIVLAALIAPSLINDSAIWYIDGLINATIWYSAFFLIWLIFKYIAYGKSSKNKIKEDKNSILWPTKTDNHQSKDSPKENISKEIHALFIYFAIFFFFTMIYISVKYFF